MWATEHETREEIIDRYRRVWEHADATITALAIDSPGYVPWWPRPNVMLFNILVHMLIETSRHAGHADILREQLDGSTGRAAEHADPQRDAAFWEARRATSSVPPEQLIPPRPDNHHSAGPRHRKYPLVAPIPSAASRGSRRQMVTPTPKPTDPARAAADQFGSTGVT